jgi:hypothetical protein
MQNKHLCQMIEVNCEPIDVFFDQLQLNLGYNLIIDI